MPIMTRDSIAWELLFWASIAGFLASQFPLVQASIGLGDEWLHRFQLASALGAFVGGRLGMSPLKLSDHGKVEQAMKALTREKKP